MLKKLRLYPADSASADASGQVLEVVRFQLDADSHFQYYVTGWNC